METVNSVAIGTVALNELVGGLPVDHLATRELKLLEQKVSLLNALVASVGKVGVHNG